MENNNQNQNKANKDFKQKNNFRHNSTKDKKNKETFGMKSFSYTYIANSKM